MAGGRIRSLFGFPKRRMSGKRIFIWMLCTVCLTLGIYIKFYNHESPDKLLIANRQAAQVDSDVIMAKPKFHRLGGGQKVVENIHENQRETGDVQQQRLNQVRTSKLEVNIEEQQQQHQQQQHEQQQERTLENDDNHNGVAAAQLAHVGRLYDAAKSDGNAKIDETQNDQVPGEDDHLRADGAPDQPVEDDGDGAHPQDRQRDEQHGEQRNEVDVPLERVEGEVDDEEENEELREAGGNGGEREEEDGEVGMPADGGGGGGDDGAQNGENGRGPHGIKLFDWDKWVKDNDFVELGNVWGYCDDENPPLIGKVLLLPDEEKGGLKCIFLFNTTLEYDVVMGSVEISFDYNDMHFYSNTFDFEELETEGDFFKTPIAKGDHYFVREQHLSSLIPKGKFYGEGRMTDQNDKVIVCTTMNLNMK